MSPLMAFMGNESERLPCWLKKLDDQIDVDFTPDDVNGWGVGHFSGDRALSLKRPHTLKPWSFYNEMGTIQSNLALWHIAPQPLDKNVSLDHQPLHFGNWLFICEGLHNTFYDELDTDEITIADHFRRKIKDSKESEFFFFYILQAIQKTGWLDNPPAQLQALVGVIQEHARKFIETYINFTDLTQLSAVLSNGRMMMVFSYNANMYMSFKEGFNDCVVCGSDIDDDYSLRESHNRARAIMVIRGLSPKKESNQWQKINDQEIVVIDRDLSAHHFRWSLK